MSEKTQTELQLAYARRSQVMGELSRAKAKHSPQEPAPSNSPTLNRANDFEMMDSVRTDNGYYYFCQLNGVRNCLSYLDARLSKLFTIFPGVSAEPVKPAEHEVTVLAKDDQSLETARVNSAFVAYVTMGCCKVIAIDTESNSVVANIGVGCAPSFIAITPNSRYAYYVCGQIGGGATGISVIDTYRNRVIANVTLNVSYPTAIAITPDGQYVYVSSTQGTQGPKFIISIIETSSNKVKTTIPACASVASAPLGIAITPNGLYAYVTCRSNLQFNSVSVIETTNNTLLTTIGVGNDQGPYGIAITTDGLYTYVANYDGNSVSVINTTSNAIIATVNYLCDKIHGSSPQCIAITPNGLYVYVTCTDDGSVSVIETTNNTVLTRIDVGSGLSRGIAITPDGLYAYVIINANSVVRNSNTVVSVINTTSNAVISTINFGRDSGLIGIAITPTKIPIPTIAPTIAPTSTPTRTPTNTPTGVPTPPTNTPTKKEDTGLIIGLSCGGVIILLVVGGLSYL
ncbi:MAG: YncE family protein [Parachlamydiaceae bacterium]|nr:YncE family protein [Parachlamydiaceae bacterium]